MYWQKIKNTYTVNAIININKNKFILINKLISNEQSDWTLLYYSYSNVHKGIPTYTYIHMFIGMFIHKIETGNVAFK